MWLACVGLSPALRQEGIVKGGEVGEAGGEGKGRGLEVWPLNDLPALSPPSFTS